MTSPEASPEMRDHFAHCIQLLGGPSAASRRMGIDERAIRRFVSGERPVSEALLLDTAKVLRELADLASAAEAQITQALGR